MMENHEKIMELYFFEFLWELCVVHVLLHVVVTLGIDLDFIKYKDSLILGSAYMNNYSFTVMHILAILTVYLTS